METITITTENHETYSAVSNFFIDYYMTSANGEFVKIYLYLVRLLNSGRAVTVADIADHFNCTEKDICRAIKYWIKEKALRLEYTSDKVLTGITVLPLKPKATQSNNASLLSMLGVTDEQNQQTKEFAKTTKKTQENAASDADVSYITNSTKAPEKKEYKADFLAKMQDDKDFGDILYLAEVYTKRPPSSSMFQTLAYIYDGLSFSTDLLEYLLEYCAEINHTSHRYMQTVAINWYEAGIHTVEEAKAASMQFNANYVAVLKQLGISGRAPTPTETSFMDTWYNTYGFDTPLVIEACKRAITNNPRKANFKSVNTILEDWKKQNVHKLSDLTAIDKAWEEEKKKRATSRTATSNQFNNYQSSTSQSAVSELESLFLKETNGSYVN